MNFNIVNTLTCVWSEYLSILAMLTYILHWISIGNFMIYIYMNTLTTLILQASVSMPLSSTVHSHVHTSRCPPVHSTVRHMSAFGTCAILHSHTDTHIHSHTLTHTHRMNSYPLLGCVRIWMCAANTYVLVRVYICVYLHVWICECVNVYLCVNVNPLLPLLYRTFGPFNMSHNNCDWGLFRIHLNMN